MSMRYIRIYISISFFVSSLAITAQDNFGSFNESVLAINHKVTKGYSINFALESRYFLYQNKTYLIKQQQLDIAHFSTFKLNFNHSLSLGLEYRNRAIFNQGSNEFRVTEQFNYKKQRLGVRYGHRIRSEQRILDTKTIFRQRYRFAVDFPLNGEKLDIGEAYLVNSVEGLLSLSKLDKPETDVRITAQIGWQLNEKLKLQIGLEHRLEAFNLITQHHLFILTNAILKI